MGAGDFKVSTGVRGVEDVVVHEGGRYPGRLRLAATGQAGDPASGHAEGRVTEEEWRAMLDRISARAEELTALSKTFRGPAEACLAFMAAAAACADLLGEDFDAVDAFRRVHSARHGEDN